MNRGPRVEVLLREIRPEAGVHMNQEYEIYEERQRFAAWVYGVTVIPVVILPVALVSTAMAEDAPLWIYALIAVICSLFTLFLLNLLQLTIRLEPGLLRVQLGIWVPLVWGNYPLHALRAVEVVQYRPLLNAGGWGMRFGRFGGRFCRFWNARGNRGVRLFLGERQYILGSQQPERLAQALKRAAV